MLSIQTKTHTCLISLDDGKFIKIINVMTEKIAGEPCLEHAYRVQLTSRTILSFSNVLVQSSGGSRPADGGGGGHPNPEITGGLASKKIFLHPSGLIFV